MAAKRRTRPKHPLLNEHALVAFLRAEAAEEPEDLAAMPWPTRVATFVLAFDGQMGNGGSQFGITKDLRVHDPTLLAVLAELRGPLAREVTKLVKRMATLGARSDILAA
jgi:hypothetical protein